jgi:hypothetical protein
MRSRHCGELAGAKAGPDEPSQVLDGDTIFDLDVDVVHRR